jgi:NAD-dependent dihydropyrimidine dehydrogenase PreA subunit
MTTDIYEKLSQRLNEFEHVVLPVPSYLKVLEEFYTEEQAEFAANFPDGKYTINEMAEMFKKDKNELEQLVEAMAYAGLLFVTRSDTGEKKFELSPWMVGVIEFSIVRRMDEPDGNRKLLPLYQAMGEEQRAIIEPMLDNIEAIKEMLPSEHVRVLTVGEAIEDKSQVMAHENLLEIIDKQESFAAMKCCCRHLASQRDEPCHLHEIPEDSCLFFGQVADYIVDYNLGKRLTKEECVGVLKTCADAGCVHNTNNFTEALQFVCNCCPDCCGFLTAVKNYGNVKTINTSNFLSVVDEDTCIVCGDCVERCPVEAISLNDDTAIMDETVCIGCGNCVTICPSGSLSMKRVSDKKPLVGEKRIGMGY